MINPGISSSPADREGFRRLTALQTSSSETGARCRDLEDCERGCDSIGQWVLKTDNNNNNNNNNNNSVDVSHRQK
jgi:hypothetical protein